MAEIGSGNNSSYPGALDTNSIPEVNSPAAGKTKARKEPIEDLTACTIAIETELGTDPAGSLVDVKTFLQTQHQTDGTHKNTHGPHKWIDEQDYANFTSAVAAAPNKTLVIARSISLDANTVIPASVSIMPINPGVIVSNGYTLTINGPVVGNPMHQWLSGFAAGDVVFSGGYIKVIYPEWWQINTTPGTTDMYTAIMCALTTLIDVQLGETTYATGTLIVMPEFSNMRGFHRNTYIRALTGAVGAIRLSSTGSLKDTQIRPESSSHTGFGLGVADAGVLISNSTVKNVDIRNFAGSGGLGLKEGLAVTVSYENLTISDNDINVLIHDSAGSNGTTTTFVNSRFAGATTKGFKVTSHQELTFEGCVFESNGEEGFYAENGSGVVSDINFDDNCHFEDNWTSVAAASRPTYFDIKCVGTDNAGVNKLQRVSIKNTLFASAFDASNNPKAMSLDDVRDVEIRSCCISNQAGQITASGITFGTYSNPWAVSPTVSSVAVTNTGNAKISTEGYWTGVSFDAGNFTASGSMTWTVDSGDVATYKYTVIGQTMTVMFYLNNTTVGGTPNTQLYIKVPAGYVIGAAGASTVYINDNGTISIGMAFISATETNIKISLLSGTNFAASTNNTSIRGEITFEVLLPAI